MKKITLGIGLIFLCFNLFAQMPGSNDPTFNPIDSGYGYEADAPIYSTAIQNDGKIILAGTFSRYNGVLRNRVARCNTDGTLDTTFHVGTGVDDIIYATVIQPDGKILIAGNFTTYNGISKKRIARLNVDGTLDASFNIGAGADWFIRTIALQTDGKIVVGGEFTHYNGVAKNYIVRLNTDGTLDASFLGTGTNGNVYSITIQTDNKIIIGGQFTNYDGTGINCIARLNADGTLDATFNVGTGTSDVRATTIQADGKIIIGGGFAYYNGTSRGHIARLNANGTLDLTFGIGSGFNGDVYSTKIQADGNIIVGGAFGNYSTTLANNLCRLNTNGSLDATFNLGAAVGPNGTIQALAIQTDGKIIVVGGFAIYNNNLSKNNVVRINANGTLDGTLNGGTGANNIISATALQSDGKIIIGGNFYSYNGVLINRIARLNADGSLDASFNVGSGANDKVLTTVVQADGKVIIGGYFTTYNGYPRSRIVRINTDGSIDLTFNMGAGANGIVYSIAIQADGKIIIVGNFTSYKGSAKNYIARLNSDGTVDGSFVSTGTDNTIWTTSIQADGKIVIGGSFGTYNGIAKNRVARINTDGSIDATFSGLGAAYNVYSIAFQSNNKIIIGGDFTSYNGTAINRIARINTDGTLDATFNIGAGVNTIVRAIAVQSDDKIIVAGDFNSFNNLPSSTVIRLDTNGTLDPLFAGVSYGFPLPTYATAIQTDGKIIVAGNFTSYGGVGRNRITRLFGGNCIPAIFSFTTVNPNCYASSSGSINAGVSGGAAPYTYSWSPSGEVTQNISNKPAGSYTLLVIDNLGCSTTTSTILSNPSVIISSVTANQIICNGASVSLAVTTTSTITPLTYTWQSVANSLNNINSASVIATPSVSEIYTVSVSNTNCVETKTLNVTVNALPSLTISPTPVITCLSSIASCTVTGAGAYMWSGPGIISGAASAIINVNLPGIYTVTVTGANSCANTGTVSVTSNTASPPFTIISNTLSVCVGSSVLITANPTGTNSVSYLWDNTATTQSISVNPTVTTVYTATVTDNTNGCYSSNSTTATVYPLPTLTVTGTNTVCLGTSTGFISTGASTYTWNTGQTTPSISVNPTSTTIYTVWGANMNGCINSQTVSVTVNSTCADVWPGDANSDGAADNLDILELGLHYTQTGALRAATSNSWQSYFANNWTGTISNGSNLNHSDCNGDGTINDDDTLAIYNNYSLIHAFKTTQTNTVNPQLSIVPDQAMVAKGTWGTASVYLGDATTNITNINGVAFTVDFDNTLIEPSNVWIEYQNSFMDASPNLYFRKLDFANSKLFTASTHTVSNNVSGFGKIAVLHYQILSNLTTDQVLNIGLSQVNQSDASGVITQLTSGTGTLMAIGASVGVKETIFSGNILISPNPTNGILNISFNTIPQNIKIEVYNGIGALVLTETMSNKNNTINMSELSSGLYFMKVLERNKVIAVKKVVKE